MAATANFNRRFTQSMFRLPLSGLALAAIVGLGGCGPRESAGSRLFHDIDDPTHSTLTHQWRDVSDSDYREFMAPLLGLRNDFVADDHPVTERMQEWIDRIDALLRKEHPSQMTGVPKPRARIIPNPSLNAFIAPIPVCYDVEVRISEAQMPVTEQIFFDIGEGSFDVWPADAISCQSAGDSKKSMAEIAAAIREFNKHSSDCKISLELDGDRRFISPGSGCVGSRDLGGFSGSKQLVLLRSANWVNIYSGLVAAMTEREVVGVIAHELGHYYRSHMNAPRDLYDFFYNAGEEVAPKRPKPVASLSAAGERALAGSKVIGTLQRFKPVKGQKVHSAMYLAMGQLAVSACQGDGDCPSDCEYVKSLADSSEFEQKTYLFPFRALNADGLKSYHEFEESALACLETVQMAKRSEVSGNEISYEELLMAVLRPRWPNWLITDADLMAATRKWLRSMALLLPESAPKKASDAASLIVALSELLWEEDSRSIESVKSAFEARLGHYTDEQEADEISVEWLSQLGIDPKAAVETYLKIGKWMESEGRQPSAALMEVGASQCAELAENDWRDRDGQFRFIPLGDLSDTHHQSCYRAFNVSREIKAHKYKRSAGGSRGMLSAEGWAELQKEARAVTAEENFSDSAADGRVGFTKLNVRGADRFFNAEVARHASHAHHFAGSGCVFSPF